MSGRILPARPKDLERIAPIYQKGARLGSLEEAKSILGRVFEEKQGSSPRGQKWHLLLGESVPEHLDALLVTGPPRESKLAGAQLHVLATSNDGMGRRLARSLVEEVKLHLRAAGVECLWIDGPTRHLSPFVEAGACALSPLPARDGETRARARLFVMRRPVELRTERLLLRHWLPSDLPRVLELGSNQQVNAHLPGPLSAEQSRELAGGITEKLEKHGFGFWAVQTLERAPTDPQAFLGFVGLSPVENVPPVTARTQGPVLEIGWRLLPEAWGKGFATEAARACLDFAFQELHVGEVVSFTVPENAASQRVMEKTGLGRDPAGDFEHPRLPEGHRLRKHMLFRKRNPHSAF